MGDGRQRSWLSMFLSSSTPLSTLTPWDRGVLEAHWMNPLRTQQIRDRRDRALRQRRGVLARIWPRRRRYLDGLLWGIAAELKRRGKDE